MANGSGVSLANSYNLNPYLLVYVLSHGHGTTSFSTCLVSSAAGWHLLDSAYSLSLSLCSDFLPGLTLLSHWPKQLYSLTSKSNTYTWHSTSMTKFLTKVNVPCWQGSELDCFSKIHVLSVCIQLILNVFLFAERVSLRKRSLGEYTKTAWCPYSKKCLAETFSDNPMMTCQKMSPINQEQRIQPKFISRYSELSSVLENFEK